MALALSTLVPSQEAEANTKATVYKSQRLIVTAYTDSPKEGGAYAATGRKLRVGDCACARNIPLGTRIYIPALRRYFTCVDRYSKRLSPRIDVYMPSRKAALKFGKKRLTVKIYRK
ncbi:3D domain-containing protein [Aneurinibacillus aneurinilyticus]|uniref:3D domain-containing protein n=1 Tax=Aneurinibacillus aneurinilyticus TaxID=1391 RepID=UPI0036730E92